MATEPVFVQITSAGSDTGPFIVYLKNIDAFTGMPTLYPLHNINYPISKPDLLTGMTFDIPILVGTQEILIQSIEGYSYPFCTNSVSSSISSTTSTTTTTTTLADCGIFEFNTPTNGYYFRLETVDTLYAEFSWDLPINIDEIDSIVSWSLQVTASQYNGDDEGNAYTQNVIGNKYDPKRNTISSSLSGSDGNTILGSSRMNSLTGNLFNGSFVFYNQVAPYPYLATVYSWNSQGYTSIPPAFDYLWQDVTTINLSITYKDKCLVTKVFNSTTIFDKFLVTDYFGDATGTGGGTCLLEGTKILLSDNTEKLIENLTENDILKGINVNGEKNQYDVFINYNHIPVEIKTIVSYDVTEIIDIFGLKMTPSHKHLILRNNTECLVVKAKDIVEGDKVYILDEMKFKEVNKIEKYSGKFKVYNIELKGDYKYYFANNQLTHNKINTTSPVSTIP